MNTEKRLSSKPLAFILALICFGSDLVMSQDQINLMTYNIKLDYPKEGENSWTQRKPFFIGQLNFYEPDILGVQEAMPNQMRDMDSLLVDYSFVGVGRDDGKDEGEYSAIFYKKDKFTIIESSTFWLSETPEKVSMGWDAACNRICTYALFENNQTKQRFWIFNTHLDHVGENARKQSVRLILNQIEKLNSIFLPVILIGDFNLEPENFNIQLIRAKLEDAKEISKTTPFGPSGTFNNFEFNKPVKRRIDYVFVSKNKIIVDKYAVLSDSKDLKYPSDHFPVYVSIAFKLN